MATESILAGAPLSLSGRFAVWGNISQQRDKTVTPDVDLREVFLKIDGPWGGVAVNQSAVPVLPALKNARAAGVALCSVDRALL